MFENNYSSENSGGYKKIFVCLNLYITTFYRIKKKRKKKLQIMNQCIPLVAAKTDFNRKNSSSSRDTKNFGRNKIKKNELIRIVGKNTSHHIAHKNKKNKKKVIYIKETD